MANATETKITHEADIDNLADFEPAVGKKAAKRAKKAIKKAEGKGKGGLFVKLFAVLLVIAIVASFWFNVMGIRDNYLMPLLQRIPVVNNLMPINDIEEEDAYEGLTTNELIRMITALEAEIEDKDDQIQSLAERNNLFAGQISDLQQFRDQQAQFKADKEEFDRLITNGAPVDFARFFENIDPENAGRLYQDAIRQEIWGAEFDRYVNMIQAMDERAAAGMLSRLIRSDSDSVANILKNMDTKKSGDILSEMSDQDAAQIVRRMYPEPPPEPTPPSTTVFISPFVELDDVEDEDEE
jgi:flagellar motility protein MotE (MotC chaperone)